MGLFHNGPDPTRGSTLLAQLLDNDFGKTNYSSDLNRPLQALAIGSQTNNMKSVVD